MQKFTAIVLVAILAVNIGLGAIALKSNGAPGAQSAVGNIVADGGFVITKLVDYSNITTSGVDITNTVQSGDLILEEMIVRTDDSVAMASGTSLVIVQSGNDYGAATIASSAISSLAAGKTLDLNDWTVGNSKTVLEDGSKLQAKCSSADCQGTNGTTGYLDITMVFSKVDRQAYIY